MRKRTRTRCRKDGACRPPHVARIRALAPASVQGIGLRVRRASLRDQGQQYVRWGAAVRGPLSVRGVGQLLRRGSHRDRGQHRGLAVRSGLGLASGPRLVLGLCGVPGKGVAGTPPLPE